MTDFSNPTFDLSEQTAEIHHPNFNDLIVVVKKPDELEKMEHFTSMTQFAIPVAVLNPISGTPIFENELNSDGDNILNSDGTNKQIMKVKELPSFPVSVIASFLVKNIIGLKGFLDKNKNPISWDSKNIKIIFSSKLNVKKDDGKEQNFWDYLYHKILDDKTFDHDPLVLN